MNILIIGGAGGIGSELLKDLSNHDSNNILVGYHNKKPDTNFESISLDASKFSEVEDFIKNGLEKFGSVDAIVCLPGNLILKPAHLCTEEEFYETIDINLKSSFGVIRSAGKLLKNCSRQRNQFGPKIVEIQVIFAIFRSFEDFSLSWGISKIQKLITGIRDMNQQILLFWTVSTCASMGCCNCLALECRIFVARLAVDGLQI